MKVLESIKQYFNKKSAYWAANYPKAWSLGWLTQFSIAVIIYPITFLVSMLIPMSLADTPDVNMWYSLGYIPASFWGIFIIYRLIKYNSEKLFGNRNWLHNFLELPTYILQFIMPLVIPFILGFVIMVRIGLLIDSQQLNDSKIAFEEAQPFFTFDYSSGNYAFRDYENDYYFYYENEYSYLHEMYRYHENDKAYYNYIVSGYNDNYNIEESQYIYENLTDEDVKRANDSIPRYRVIMRDSIGGHKGIFENSRPKLYPYYFYEFPPYRDQYVGSHFEGEDIFSVDSLKQIYFHDRYKDVNFVRQKYSKLLTHMNNFKKGDKAIFNIDELMSLYNNNVYSVKKESALAEKVGTFDRLVSNYRNQINYIQECKDRDFFFVYDDGFYGVLFGFIFGLVLVFSLFKNMSWVEFLVGLFVVFLIPILLGIFMAITKWDEDQVFFAFWFLFIGLTIWSLIERRGKIRRKRGAILFMIPHLCMAFVPIAILVTLDEIYNFWEWSYFDKYLVHTPTSYDPKNMSYNYEYRYMKEASVSTMITVGYLLYIFILYPLWIKVEWLKFLAKPKKS